MSHAEPLDPDAVPAGEEMADLLARFDSILAGEVPSEQESDGTAPPVTLDGSLRELCDFLLLMETAWPRKGDDRPGQPAFRIAQACGSAERRTLGRFRLIREIGRGGHGIVFLAEDPKSEKLVALKVPNPGVMTSRELKRRFLREARATASLNHPSIVAIYEAGEISPVCYIASAYAPGTNLAAWLAAEQRPVAPRLAATIVFMLAEAVQHAHSRGVLHRDIKPSNVLLEALPEGQSATRPPLEPFGYLPKLCDFGLAKVTWADGDSLATRTGEVIGTPAYMAPEAASPALGPMTPAADVYSLGALLYELLTREVPHRGVNELDTFRRITEDFVPSPRRWRGDIDRDLTAVCLKCLEKRSGDRYPSALALAEDLERYLSGHSVHARPVPALVRLRRWAARRPALAALSACLAVTVIVGFAGVFWQWRRAEANLAIARAERQRAEQHWVEENRLVSELFRNGEHVTPDSRPLLRARVRKRLIDRYRAIVEGDGSISHSPAEVATASTKYALLTSGRGGAQRLQILLRGIATWRELAGQHPHDPMIALGLADAELDAAFVYLSQNDLERAAEFAEAAYLSFNHVGSGAQQFDEEQFRLGAMLHMIADAYMKQGAGRDDLTLAAESYLRAVDYWRGLLARWPDNSDYERELAECLGRASDCEERRHNLPTAIAMRLERTEVDTRLIKLAPDQIQSHLKLAQDHHRLAELQTKAHQPDDARRSLQECERVVQHISTMDQAQQSKEQRAGAAMTLGHIHDTLGHTAEAAARFANGATTYSELSRDQPEVFQYRREHSEALFWTARLQGALNDPLAIELFERALQVATGLAAAPQATHHDRAQLQRCHIVYARYLAQAGLSEKSREHFRISAEMVRKFLKGAPEEPNWLAVLAECESALQAAE